MMPVAWVFFNRPMNIMAGFIIGPAFIGVSVIRLISIITDEAPMALMFGSIVRPLMILRFFVVVSACFFPLVLLMGRFVLLGNSGLLLFGFFVAPIVFAVRPCYTGKYKNTCCRQDTDQYYFRFHWFTSFVLDFD
jgi:hypothetical protein